MSARAFSARLIAEAKRIAKLGLHGAVMLHGISYEQAADLWMGGFCPDAVTGIEPSASKPTTYFRLRRSIDGISITVFTDSRPATASEAPPIERVAVERVAEAERVRVEEPMRTPDPAPSSRWALLEVDA